MHGVAHIRLCERLCAHALNVHHGREGQCQGNQSSQFPSLPTTSSTDTSPAGLSTTRQWVHKAHQPVPALPPHPVLTLPLGARTQFPGCPLTCHISVQRSGVTCVSNPQLQERVPTEPLPRIDEFTTEDLRETLPHLLSFVRGTSEGRV